MLGIKNIMSKKQSLPVPEIFIEESLSTRFAKNHVHFLHGEINEDNMEKAYEWLLYENLDPTPKKLTLYVNSTGGNLYEALGFIDLMKTSPHIIETIGIGSVMSSGFLIFMAGTRGHRYIGKHSSILCHQHSNEIDGKYHDLKSHIMENHNCHDRMLSVIHSSAKLGITVDTIKEKLLSATDNWLTVDDVITYGLADFIL